MLDKSYIAIYHHICRAVQYTYTCIYELHIHPKLNTRDTKPRHKRNDKNYVTVYSCVRFELFNKTSLIHHVVSLL